MVKTKKKYLVPFKPYDIAQYDKLFANFPHQHHCHQHLSILTDGTHISLNDHYPSFSTLDKIGICQQLHKWLNTGIVLGSFDKTYAEKNGVTIHMVFGVSKLDGSTRPILNLSDKKWLTFSINDLLHTNLWTVEYVQTK